MLRTGELTTTQRLGLEASKALAFVALAGLAAPEMAHAEGAALNGARLAVAATPDHLTTIETRSSMSTQGAMRRILHYAFPDNKGWRYFSPYQGSIAPSAIEYKTNCKGENEYDYQFYKRSQTHSADYLSCSAQFPLNQGPATHNQYKSGANSIGHSLEKSVGVPVEGAVKSGKGNLKKFVVTYKPSSQLGVKSVYQIALYKNHEAVITYY